MKAKILLDKLNSLKNENLFYKYIIEDIDDYICSDDTEDDVEDSVLHNFLEQQLANGTYNLQEHLEARSCMRDFIEDILDIYTYATKDDTNNTILLPSDHNWWTYEGIILGAVKIVVADLQHQIFNNNPIPLPYGYKI